MSWPVVELGSVVSFIGGSQPPKSTFKYELEEGYVRLLQIRDYKSDDNLTYIPDNSTKKFCTKDDVMIGRYGPPVFQILRGLEGAYNVALMKAQPSEKVDRDYLFYFLKQEKLFRLIDGLSQRTAGQSGVDMDALKAYPMPLPPLEEQKRIAAILDKADSVRRKRQQAIDLADDFLRSVFLDMSGDPVTNPKGWDVTSVGKVVDCIVPGRDKPKSFTGDMPWITTNDLNHLGTTCKSEKSMGLSDEEIASVKARIIPKGSVLMTCVGDLGVISLAGNDMVMNQQLHAFLPNENLAKEFLIYALSFQKHYMLKMASSTTVPYMNKTVCNSVPIILPPIDEQNRFKELYTKASAFKERLQRTGASKSDFFNSVSQKAFAGEL